MRVIREFRPHVMTTYDENGGYPHPDHIRCHEVSMAAYEAAADPEQFPDAGEPWKVQKVYYSHGFIRKRSCSSRRSTTAAAKNSRWPSGSRSGRPSRVT